MGTTHLFGEMDLDLTQTRSQILKEASRIADQCGYGGNSADDTITLCSNDCDRVVIKFQEDKVIEVKRSGDDGKTWENLNFKDDIFEVNEETLKKYNEKIEYHLLQQKPKMPMSQGFLINEVIQRYKIPAIAVGWHFDHIGVETPKQFILWRDTGVGAELLGIIEKVVQYG